MLSRFFNILGPRQHGRNFTDDILDPITFALISFKFHWNMLQMVEMTRYWHWSRQQLGNKQATNNSLNQWQTFGENVNSVWSYYKHSLSIWNCRNASHVITYRMLTLSKLLILYEHWSLHKCPVMWSFNVFFVIIINNELNQQLSCRRSETLMTLILRHCCEYITQLTLPS